MGSRNTDSNRSANADAEPSERVVGSSTTYSSPDSRATIASCGTAPFKPLGDDAQHLVARRVAEAVVDVLEPVEVDEVQGGFAIGAPRLVHVGRDAVEQQRAVGQAGQARRSAPA